VTRNSHEVPSLLRARVPARASALILVLAFICGGCDYQVYATQAGEHVTYHWDADVWAAEGTRLCGGTVEAADRYVAGIANHYGWTLADDGPTTEYFWDQELSRSACSWGHVTQCTTGLGHPSVFTHLPLDGHELAHTTSGGHTMSLFINEAFATRWQSGATGDFIYQTTEFFLDEDQLCAQLELGFLSSKVDPWAAFTWWVALETTYGPAKMGEFIDELETSSVRDVERALQRVFGISLAESAALAEALPPMAIADPVCQFDGLPTRVWDGEPLIMDRDDARCEDADIVTLDGNRASWLMAIEFPQPEIDVEVRVTVSDGDPIQKDLVLVPCNGDLLYGPTSYDPLSPLPADEPGRQRSLGGRYVANLVGVLKADGSVVFPRAVIQELPP
jgi:hypothetical protein